MKHLYSIVLPCYNEAENIFPLIERFRPFSEFENFELILVNNGSTDNSSKIFSKALKDKKNFFLNVITIEKNIGYGNGIQSGLKKAKGNILAYSHADIQTPPEDLFKALKMIKSGEVNLDTSLIKGFRINRSDEKSFLTSWLAKVVHFFMGVKMEDINGQPKVFSKKFFESFEKPPDDFSYDVFVIYWAFRKGLNIKTFDVDFGERIFGKSKWSSNIFLRYKTILGYLYSISKLSWLNRNDSYNPLGKLIRLFTIGSSKKF